MFVIVICGPTASGKTAISLKLSEIISSEIISADSRQIYKYLDIGTAKPSQAELNSVKHHFIDLLNPDISYSAGEFGNNSYSVALEINSRGKVPIVVGGSGLYIKALCEGLIEDKCSYFYKSGEQMSSRSVRAELELELLKNGVDFLYERLRLVDEPLYLLYNDKNPRRVLRALEYHIIHNERLSDAWSSEKYQERHIQPLYVMPDLDRDILYDKINKRVLEMWEMGLVSETERVLNMGYNEKLNSLNTVGYKEVIMYLKNDLSKDCAIAEIQKNTRHYAKRQLTWFRKQLMLR